MNAEQVESTLFRCGEAVESQRRLCVNIAKGYDYDLELPKSGNNNNSLKTFCFGDKGDPDSLYREPRKYLDLPVVHWTEGGKKTKPQPSLSAKDAIPQYLISLPQGSKQLTFVKALKTKAKMEKFVGDCDTYMRYWLPLEGHAGYFLLHPQINPTGSVTLRWSHTNPNSANISKQESECLKCEGEGCSFCGDTGQEYESLRRCFGPAPSREWWSLDAKNIELRIPAYKSGEKELIALFERPDDPPYFGSQHLLNFSTVYPDVWADAVGKQGIDKAGPWCKKHYAATYYQWCKNGDFAIQYNCGENTADKAFRRKGSFRLLKSRFSKLEALNQSLIRLAEKQGYIETEPDRSIDPKHGYPLACSRTEYGGILPTIPLSYYTQGTAMWWTMQAMVRTQEQLDKWRRLDGFDGYLILQVHDELCFDFPKRGNPVQDAKGTNGSAQTSNLWRIKKIQQLMAKGGEGIGIPTPVGLSYHPSNWGESVEL